MSLLSFRAAKCEGKILFSLETSFSEVSDLELLPILESSQREGAIDSFGSTCRSHNHDLHYSEYFFHGSGAPWHV